MADVAELAGVSKSTVSAVLNNKAIVKDGTRRRVLKAVDSLNYRLHSLSHNRTSPAMGKTIGYIIKDADNLYYAEVLAGIREVAREAGYLVFVSSSEGEYAIEQQISEALSAREFDGLIITSPASCEN